MNHPNTTPTPPLKPARLATPADLEIIAAHLREESRNECMAGTGLDALTSLMQDRKRTYVIDGCNNLPVASITLGPAGEKDCAIWVAACTTARRSVTDFITTLAAFCMELHGTYDAVHALVDVRNVSMAILLRDCGFVFEQRLEKFGHEQRPWNLYTSRARIAGKAN